MFLRHPPFVKSTPASKAAGEGHDRGDHARAHTIAAAWEACGYDVRVWVTINGDVRSDLINGLPPRTA